MDDRMKMVRPGDVITSELFACGHKLEDGRLWVGRVFGDDKRGPFYDPDRASARYVVEDAFWTGPTGDDVWLVWAARLKDDGSFDPDGERIAFYQRADYTAPFIDEVGVVGRMKRVISFVAE